jgi:hypothetical protein
VVGLAIDGDAVDADGTPYLEPPCSGRDSRWLRDEADAVCANTADLGQDTLDTFRDLIAGRDTRTEAHNPNVVTVRRAIRSCDDADADKLGLGSVLANGACWKHVHPSHLNVVDLTEADSRKYTLTGVQASFAQHADYFYDAIHGASAYPVVGALDDHVALDGDEPSPLDQPAVQDAHRTHEYNPARGPVVVCGSPNEVASDPFYGDRGFDVGLPQGTGYRSFTIWEYSAQRHTAWTHIALHAADQLRQKMAWSLSQIVAVGLPGSGMVFNEETENYIAFYDLFTTHAFGNYLQLMKDFSFNVIMGEWLSFEGNKSLQYNIEEEGKDSFPDENVSTCVHTYVYCFAPALTMFTYSHVLLCA